MKKKQSSKRKKLGLKEVCVHMGLFDYKVNFVIGDYKKLNEYVSWKFDYKNFMENESSCAPRGMCCFRTGYCPIIWIPRKPKTAREHATLAHECLHAVFHLFEWVGLPVTRNTEEVMTHSMSHLITSILKNL